VGQRLWLGRRGNNAPASEHLSSLASIQVADGHSRDALWERDNSISTRLSRKLPSFPQKASPITTRR